MTRPATRISVLLRDDSRPLLIEERPGYDALVVHNAFQAGNALVFQAISEPDDADPALHEYRVDWPEARGGQLVNAGAFEVTVQVGGGFRARASQLSLSCKLQREEPKPDLDKHGPVRYEEPEPPLPPSSDGKANG
ncbi:MAG TPA: hypothetical protein VGP93_10475 [Polyangiaceae bacterium]|nr:hypothetical protein [Polyangiaceae bacterium]